MLQQIDHNNSYQLDAAHYVRTSGTKSLSQQDRLYKICEAQKEGWRQVIQAA